YFTGPLDAQAQNTQLPPSVQLKPLKRGVHIYTFTGNLNWHTYYALTPTAGLSKESQTELYAAFQNITMLNAHFGLGYKFFTTVYMYGFFDGIGLGSVGLGPVARYFPLKSTRWQPYLQASFSAGYNLASTDKYIRNDDEFAFIGALQAGLSYKLSDRVGLFIEAGPNWQYN